VELAPGDVLTIETPGGGGWGTGDPMPGAGSAR
jgi:N-methylhydantoinase B/oxoprolinase/acetone carboxylase alpha subunit